MNDRTDVNLFRALPLFRDCDSVPLQILAFTADRQEFGAGEEIFAQGKKTRAAFLIYSGQVRLYSSGLDIGVAEAGALLGETGMIGGGSYSITAVAIDMVSTLRISRELFLKVVREYPEFAKIVLRNLGDRLDTSVRELEAVRIMMNRSRNFSDL
jgi:CRP/FNR family transcriptional regulator, cyclic AMP receptor protein